MWQSPRIVARFIYWALYRGSTQLITVSDAIKHTVFKGRNLEKVNTVYDGLEPTWFTPPDNLGSLRKDLNISMRQPVVITVARLCPQKGIHCFVEAAALVHKKHPEAIFLVVGDIPRPRYADYKDELENLVKGYQLENVVRFLGWRSDVKQLLALASVNILASIGPEGAGRVIPEGWAVGTPAVVANHSGPAELVRDGVDGFHFSNGDACSLADKIERLLDHPGQITEMGRRGRERALRLFDARENAQQVQSIWEQAIQQYI
jgi:glycosyltransferase involved in cell wall biosynthesis